MIIEQFPYDADLFLVLTLLIVKDMLNTIVNVTFPNFGKTNKIIRVKKRDKNYILKEY